MKSTALFALFLLSAFTSYLPSATADFVVDASGEPILNGGSYYVLPPIFGKGGLKPAKTGNETCPLTVVQSPFEVNNGKPVKIASPYKILYITEGLPLYLSFSAENLPPCAPTPSQWTIVKGLSEEPAVKLTGYENPVIGWFNIKKTGNKIYKFVFCAGESGSCENVGTDENGSLVLTKHPLKVIFVKPDGTSSTV